MFEAAVAIVHPTPLPNLKDRSSCDLSIIPLLHRYMNPKLLLHSDPQTLVRAAFTRVVLPQRISPHTTEADFFVSLLEDEERCVKSGEDLVHHPSVQDEKSSHPIDGFEGPNIPPLDGRLSSAPPASSLSTKLSSTKPVVCATADFWCLTVSTSTDSDYYSLSHEEYVERLKGKMLLKGETAAAASIFTQDRDKAFWSNLRLMTRATVDLFSPLELSVMSFSLAKVRRKTTLFFVRDP